MTQISVSELKANAGKYVSMAQEQDILITKNGKILAKLVTAKVDKRKSLTRLQQLFKGVKISDEDVVRVREERLR